MARGPAGLTSTAAPLGFLPGLFPTVVSAGFSAIATRGGAPLLTLVGDDSACRIELSLISRFTPRRSTRCR